MFLLFTQHSFSTFVSVISIYSRIMPRSIRHADSLPRAKRIKLAAKTQYLEPIESFSDTRRIMNSKTTNNTETDMSSISFAFQTSNHRRDNMVEKLQLMMEQEKFYKCDDYMKPLLTRSASIISSSSSNDVCNLCPIPKSEKPVDLSCREKIVEWCYRVVDYFESLDRETVYFAMSYLDRLMVVHPVDRPNYKLAATTALLLAIKLHQPRTVSLYEHVNELSSGSFGVDEVMRMELVMLKALNWRLNPSTPANFVLRIIALNPFASQRSIWEFDMDSVQTLAIFLVELSISDYFFVTRKSSILAIAAILNAMECLGMFKRLRKPWHIQDAKSRSLLKFLDIIFDSTGISKGDEEVTECRCRLWELYRKSDECKNRKRLEHSMDGYESKNTEISAINEKAGPPKEVIITNQSSPKTIA